jgi:Holliday junction resolvase RusA-like endonuclease
MIDLTIPRLAPSLNGSGGLIRMHHQAYKRLRDQWSLEILAEALRHHRGRGKLERFSCQITRFYCPHPLDLDNLYAAAKVPLDALRHAGLIVEDNPEALVSLTCNQERVATKKEVRTEIILVPKPQPDTN